MQKRIISIFCVITLLMTTLIYRIYYINAADYLTMAAAGQGSYDLSVATTRGMIYDRNMKSMVNLDYQYIASVLPSPQATAAVLPAVMEGEREAVIAKLSETMPFALVVTNNGIYARGVDVFRIPQRYGDYQYAPHIIGYLGGDNLTGVAGIEKAYDKQLKTTGGKINCVYQMDAAGHVMQNAAINVNRENEKPAGGVCLTLDRELQMLAQESLKAGCEKGAAIIMEVKTGNILAAASIPAFDQNNIAESLNRTDSPFISRATSGYNIGSVFKIVMASAALDKGVSQYEEHYCEGFVDIDGVVFHCNNNAIHGMCDMQKALNVSCNTYFIALAQKLGAEYLLAYCKNLGLARAQTLAPGLSSQTGNLPTAGELQNPAALATLGFGQGSSLATPLQMASIVSTIVNRGIEVAPRLVRGTTLDGIGLTQEEPTYAANQIISQNSADIVKKLMVGVVADGSGRTAKPVTGGAGGKTSSAQTGQLVDGKEIVHAWFAGFYPADEPEYSIVVFVEGGESGEQVAAPIFKSIADGIAQYLKAK